MGLVYLNQNLNVPVVSQNVKNTDAGCALPCTIVNEGVINNWEVVTVKVLSSDVSGVCDEPSRHSDGAPN